MTENEAAIEMRKAGKHSGIRNKDFLAVEL